MMGLGQAVSILVGQRLGADRPDLAERSTYTGLTWMAGYMGVVAAVYLALPGALLALFESDHGTADFAAVAAIVPGLLVCVAVFSVADALNLTFAFALRGAGDTRFVTLMTFALAWPILIVPTYLVVSAGGSLYWAWWFATAHIFAMAACFFLRFRGGKWKTMRVIEPEVGGDGVGDGAAPEKVAAG
jgi:multidrug resistance protein, MATE family